MHGWIILDKPLGLGSTDCVSAVKRALRQGGLPKLKVGHGGTLDPLATGVLPIALGEATKLAGRMLDSDKAYDFTIRFGEQTDTLDAEGMVIATSAVRPLLEDVRAVLPRFTGTIDQMPPVYSALKVGGKRAYDLARAGEEVELAARPVTVHALSIMQPSTSRHPELVSGSMSSPAEASPTWMLKQVQHDGGELNLEEVTLSASVSKGTYVRSLARDIALALGTLGHVTMLRRTKAGPFTLAQAISLDLLGETAKAQRLQQVLLPLRAGLDDIPALSLTPDQAKRLRQGQDVVGIAARPGLSLATSDDVPVALVELAGDALRVVRGFNC